MRSALAKVILKGFTMYLCTGVVVKIHPPKYSKGMVGLHIKLLGNTCVSKIHLSQGNEYFELNFQKLLFEFMFISFKDQFAKWK